MSMIECSECKQQRSEYAAVCPHCGLPPDSRAARPAKVMVTDIDMRFPTMIGFLVKLAIAAIPAIIILAIFGAVLIGVLSGVMHK